MKYLNGLMRPGNWLRYIRSLREMVWPGGRPYQAQTRQPDEAEDRTTRSVAHRCLRAGFRGFLPALIVSDVVYTMSLIVVFSHHWGAYGLLCWINVFGIAVML